MSSTWKRRILAVGVWVYPYLLRGLAIDRANQVWCSDITVADLHEGLSRYFEFYDHRRKHQSLDHRTPHEVYHASLAGEPQPGNGG
jgi:transposase InsO family protein